MDNMRTEIWHGKEIRFVEIEGEWWAILKDICDALKLRTDKVSHRLDPDMMVRVPVEVETKIPKEYNKKDNHPSKVVVKSKKDIIPSRYIVKDEVLSKDINFTHSKKTVHMLAVNEIGIYEALYASKKLEARKFRRWSAEVMKKLRRSVGLQGYQVMQMTEKEVQEDIDYILDTLFYDEETGMLMQSVTVAGGDVELIPFEFR